MDLDEPILNRIQCIRCSTFLSLPFLLTADSMVSKDQIKLSRYKGDNINYHSKNDFNNSGKILYSFIHCLKCSEKVGYWMSQASIKQKENINHIFFFTKCVNVVRYNKGNVSEEEDKKFKQEEAFYNSQFLTNEVFNYAKMHIDNFLNNLKKFEIQRTEAKHCYDSFNRNILTLKDLFGKIIQSGKKNNFKLDIDFSKEEISGAQLRNKIRAKTFEKYSNNNLNEEDSKSNGRKIDENEEIIEENGKNGINGINNNGMNNGNDNNIIDNRLNNNGGDEINMNELSNNLKSDIYLDEKQRQKNNKEPSKNVKKKNKKKK